jgi:hypothetical protein
LERYPLSDAMPLKAVEVAFQAYNIWKYVSIREKKRRFEQLNLILDCLEYVNWYGNMPY